MNVVTIDFDLIMAPCIDLYNPSVPRKSWEELLARSPVACAMSIDGMHYQRLTHYLIQMSNIINKDNIHFINSHEAILKLLPSNEPIYLTNFDHHHDVGYNKNEPENINCSNWVKYVSNLKHYTWINNENSDMSQDEIINATIPFKDFDFRTLQTPDLIIISYSSPWIPPLYRPLFFLWMDILNDKYGTHFNIEE